MKRYFLLGIFFLLTISLCPLQAEGYKVEDIPLVHLQNRTRYVSNPDGILSDAAVAVMDTTLFALEQKTGIQTLVVAVRQIEGGDCFDFAYQWVKKRRRPERQRQRTGHPAGHRGTVHPVCHRIRSGRYPSRCHLQTYPNPLHESLPKQR